MTDIQQEMLTSARNLADAVFKGYNMGPSKDLEKGNGFIFPCDKFMYQMSVYSEKQDLARESPEDAVLKITITPRPPISDKNVVDAVVDAVVKGLGADREWGDLPQLRFGISKGIDQFMVSISASEKVAVRTIAVETIFNILLASQVSLTEAELDAIGCLESKRYLRNNYTQAEQDAFAGLMALAPVQKPRVKRDAKRRTVVQKDDGAGAAPVAIPAPVKTPKQVSTGGVVVSNQVPVQTRKQMSTGAGGVGKDDKERPVKIRRKFDPSSNAEPVVWMDLTKDESTNFVDLTQDSD